MCEYRADITLGEVKAHCAEQFREYGDKCCEHCKFVNLGCCDAPTDWKVDAAECRTGQPNWEETCKELSADCEYEHNRANALEAENAKLRTIVHVVEAMLGRKFDV